MDSDTMQLERMEVTGDRAQSYTAATVQSISKQTMSLLEDPQDIQLIPRSLLNDQGVIRLDDALRNVAGVTVGGYYENWDYFRIRGFAADFNTYIDGLPGGNGTGEETFGLEQVEILKGPASSLFGSGPLGGLVDLVSKHPRNETFADVQLTYGDFNYRSATIDFNTPLGSSNFLLRVPLLVSAQDSFINFANKRTRYFGPAFTWKINASTELTILGKYREVRIMHAMPLPAEGTVLPNINGPIPSDVYNGEPGSNKAYENSGQIGYEFRHKFSDHILFEQNARYDRFVEGWRDMLYPGYLGADERTLYRYPYNYWQDWHDFAIDSRVEAKFSLFGVENSMVGGIEQFRKAYNARFQTIDFSDPNGYGYIGIDLYNPVYGTPIPNYQPIGGSHSDTLNTGYYWQDHLRFTHGVALTVGARYDHATADSVSVDAFSPRVGVTWEFAPSSVLYANYSKSFNPQGTFMTTLDGAPVKPETGVDGEVGLKRAAADGRLTATVALFRLTRENVATTDLLHPGFYLVSGQQRSQGVEFDGRFSPAPGWELIAAYAYTDARITQDNTLPVGERTNGVPYNSVQGWTKYTFQAGKLKGFGIGAGLHYYSAQVGDETHTHYFELPPYALVDFALYYKRDRFEAQINVNNALDRRYYSGAYDDLYVLPGEPRSIRAQVGYRF